MTAAAGPDSRGRHWDDRYERIGAEDVSWFQARPNMSMALIETLRVDTSTSVIDIGGEQLHARRPPHQLTGATTSLSSTCPAPPSTSPGTASTTLTV
jgi:hypothetical protein